ncbi:MAG TPA: hypothetical protein DCL00_02110 [Opitutae bacterium]|nr:hypothetical protein [Opitutae bacterium]
MQVRIKENLFSAVFYDVDMDTFAFWLPLLLLFISALIGAVIKRRSCDHCLKKFQGNKILVPLHTGAWICGRLEVFAQGIELELSSEQQIGGILLQSHIIHSSEVDKLAYLIRQAPDSDTWQGVAWKKERERLLHPSIQDRMKRSVLNSYNMLRDSFGQAIKAIIGSISKDTKLAKSKDSDKRLHEVQTNLTGMVPNAWEPILEKYRGKKVAIEREIDNKIVVEAGILEDYSNKYLLLRDVHLTENTLKDHLLELGCSDACAYDVIYSRTKAALRFSLLN